MTEAAELAATIWHSLSNEQRSVIFEMTAEEVMHSVATHYLPGETICMISEVSESLMLEARGAGLIRRMVN